jgi:hypothetical protein
VQRYSLMQPDIVLWQLAQNPAPADKWVQLLSAAVVCYDRAFWLNVSQLTEQLPSRQQAPQQFQGAGLLLLLPPFGINTILECCPRMLTKHIFNIDILA